MRFEVAFFVIGVLAATPAVSCAFHGYSPQSTMTEQLLSSDHIVLARPTAENPFRFGQIVGLEGSSEFVEIPHLVDSTVRRRLASNPEDSVLFARDGDYGPWKRIAYIDPGMSQVLDHVMERLPDWEMGADEERFTYFASLLDHPAREIRNQALRELDLADYSLLRTLPLSFDTQRMVSRLGLIPERSLKPIRILLLGLSGDPNVQGILEAGAKSNSAFSGELLGAYATALIELGGPEAVHRLVTDYLSDASVPMISRERVAEALAIHSIGGAVPARDAIRVAVADAVEDDPALALMIARQFGARYDWSQRAAISDVMRAGAVQSPIEMLLLTQYVALADEAEMSTGN